jgi:hypothetical protein
MSKIAPRNAFDNQSYGADARRMSNRESTEWMRNAIEQANQTWKVGDPILSYKGRIPTTVKEIKGDILVLENGESMHRSHGQRP